MPLAIPICQTPFRFFTPSIYDATANISLLIISSISIPIPNLQLPFPQQRPTLLVRPSVPYQPLSQVPCPYYSILFDTYIHVCAHDSASPWWRRLKSHVTYASAQLLSIYVLISRGGCDEGSGSGRVMRSDSGEESGRSMLIFD